MKFSIETEMEKDGRWIAEIKEIPGVIVYGKSETEAIHKAQALALRVLAEKLENEEVLEDFANISFATI